MIEFTLKVKVLTEDDTRIREVIDRMLADGRIALVTENLADARPPWYAILRAGESEAEWEFRSVQDGSLLGGGGSADLRAAVRAVKAGPPASPLPPSCSPVPPPQAIPGIPVTVSRRKA